jgi:hypothetical protein
MKTAKKTASAKGTEQPKSAAPVTSIADAKPVAAAAATEDKSLPFLPFQVDGVEFKLCTDFDAWADAEYKFSLEGYNANLLRSFLSLNFGTTRNLFACSLQHYHPEIGFEQALKMLTPPYAAAAGALFAREITKQLPAAARPDLTPQAVS